jgi:hypothetical protein
MVGGTTKVGNVGGRISYCKSASTVVVSGAVSDLMVGGMIGDGGAQYSSSTGTVTVSVSGATTVTVGGFAGFLGMEKERLWECYASGSVSVTGGGSYATRVGGLVGCTDSEDYVGSSFAIGNVVVTNASNLQSGALIGEMNGNASSVVRCYYSAQQTVSGNNVTVVGESISLERFANKAFQMESLVWNEKNWVLSEGSLPEVKLD